jgi:integrase
MASIKKLPNGTFQATVYVGRDASGRMLREYFTRRTRREAADAARIREQEIADGDVTSYATMSLKAFQALWLDLYGPRLSPSTERAYRMYERVHITPALGDIKLNKLNAMHLQQYFINKEKTTLSSNTLRRHYFYLSRILKTALKHKSPLLDVDPPSEANYTPVLLTQEMYPVIRQLLSNTELELPFLLASMCGLRAGEICALRWNDIQTRDSTEMRDGTQAHITMTYIRIDESLVVNAKGSTYTTKGPKSKRGVRVIAAPESVVACLARYPRGGDEDRIYVMRPDSLGKKWHKWLTTQPKELHLPQIRFHDLRHYHATRLWMEGFSDKYAAARLGHDEWVLRKKYQHMEESYLTETDKAVLSAFSDDNHTAQNTAQPGINGDFQ